MAAVKNIFSGHESFSLRYGWLKKGFDAIESSPALLSNIDEAMLVLGVGKNMVRSIRHWGIVCKLWEPDPDHVSSLRPSPIGRALLSDSGWDPWLEDEASLWIVHALMVQPPAYFVTAGHLFSRQGRGPFSKLQIVNEVQTIAKDMDRSRLANTTLQRDVDVALRTYVPSKRIAVVTEDTLDCPLSSLGLIEPPDDAGLYIMRQSPRPELPTLVFGFALLRWLQWRLEQGRHNVASFDDLSTATGAPGRIFGLTESALMEHITALQEYVPNLVYDDTAGVRQLLIPAKLPIPRDFLAQYYSGREAE